MEADSPYQPPKGEILPDEKSTNRRPRRPTSHKWILVMFTLAVALRAHLLRKMPEVDALMAVEIFFPVIPVIALIFFRYARATYYITTPCLVWFIGGGVLGIIENLQRVREEGIGMFIPGTIISICFVALLALLTWKYIFGNPSRAYYGFTGTLG